MLDINIIRPRYEEKLVLIETNNIKKKKLGFMIQGKEKDIGQILSIVVLHGFDNIDIFDDDTKLKLFDLSNTIVYE
jgi:hypothetical protein